MCDGPAFFTGLFYNSLDEAFEIVSKWKKENIINAYIESPKKGLDTELEGKKFESDDAPEIPEAYFANSGNAEAISLVVKISAFTGYETIP